MAGKINTRPVARFSKYYPFPPCSLPFEILPLREVLRHTLEDLIPWIPVYNKQDIAHKCLLILKSNISSECLSPCCLTNYGGVVAWPPTWHCIRRHRAAFEKSQDFLGEIKDRNKCYCQKYFPGIMECCVLEVVKKIDIGRLFLRCG